MKQAYTETHMQRDRSVLTLIGLTALVVLVPGYAIWLHPEHHKAAEAVQPAMSAEARPQSSNETEIGLQTNREEATQFSAPRENQAANWMTSYIVQPLQFVDQIAGIFLIVFAPVFILLFIIRYIKIQRTKTKTSPEQNYKTLSDLLSSKYLDQYRVSTGDYTRPWDHYHGLKFRSIIAQTEENISKNSTGDIEKWTSLSSLHEVLNINISFGDYVELLSRRVARDEHSLIVAEDKFGEFWITKADR